MSAIPGGGIGFDVLLRTEQARRETADVVNRFKRAADEVKRIKADAPVGIDTKRVKREAEETKRILRGVQREAELLARTRGAGAGDPLRPRFGGLTPSGGGPLGAGAGGAGGGGIEGAASAAAIMRAGVLFTTAATEIALAARDMKAAAARGDLAGQLRAENARNAFAKSMPFGIGALGGNIRELITGEQAGIDQTEFEAEQVNQKAAFMARQNERLRSEEEAAQKAKALEVQKFHERVRAAAEEERIEGEHFDKMRTLQEQYEADVLESQGKLQEAQRARLISGLNETQRELERAAQTAENRGDAAKAARLRQEAGIRRGIGETQIGAFDREQQAKAAAGQQQEEEQRRRDFDEMSEWLRRQNERIIKEGREAEIRDLEGQLRQLEDEPRISGQGEASGSAALRTLTPRESEADKVNRTLKTDIKTLLEQIQANTKNPMALTS